MQAPKRKSLEEASIGELRSFARLFLGLELPENSQRDHTLAAISQVYQGTDIPILEDAQTQPMHHAGSARNVRKRVDARGNETDVTEVQIELHTSEEPGGNDPVPLSVNGVAILVPRGKPVWIADHYVECLLHAEGAVYAPYTEGLGGLEDRPRMVKSYTFSFV